MTPLRIQPTESALRVLALGAHADDIEIGAGGTLLRWQAEREVQLRAVVFSASDDRRVEAERSAEQLYQSAAGWALDVLDFDENIFPGQISRLKSALADLRSFDPHVILTHRVDDRHQDHRTVGELTWQAFRDHLIIQYEIPKWEGDLATPNAYSALSTAIVERKIAIIESAFGSQHDKPWFDAATFRGIARIRGVECGHQWAEGFHTSKMLIKP